MAIMNHNHKDTQPHTETCRADPPIWGDGHDHFYTNNHAAAEAETPSDPPCGVCKHPVHVAGSCRTLLQSGTSCDCKGRFETVEPSTAVVDELIDDRVQVYGDPVDAFTRQAQAISALLDHEVHAWQVPLIMIMVKMVRVTEAPDYSDNSDDIEGYLDIFRKLMGEDMIPARSVKEYVALKKERGSGRYL